MVLVNNPSLFFEVVPVELFLNILIFTWMIFLYNFFQRIF